MLSLKDIKAAINLMKGMEVKPRVVESETEADYLTKMDRALGLEYTWSIGDEYYLVPITRQEVGR